MKKIIRILFLLLIPSGLFSQLSPVTSQYILNPLTINPSLAGNRGALNIAAFYRSQWVGIDGAPKTISLAVDTPFPNSRFGLGLIITNDNIGVTRETRYNTCYAFKINMKEGNLSLGLGAGVITTNTAWSDLTVNDPGDESYLVSSRVFVVPDFSFGVYYSRQNYFAGVSVPELLGYSFDYTKNKYALKFDPGQYHYLLNTGFMFRLSSRLIFLPSALITFSSGEKLLYDINVHFNISDRLWLGVSYRNNRSVGGLIQFAVNQQLKIAYSYDFDFGALGRYSNGSHEVMLRYMFQYKVKVVNQLIF
jgi:type IX secretion system PorP/SprF family membrane protein